MRDFEIGRYVSLILLGFLAAGCSTFNRSHLTEEVILNYGTKTFTASSIEVHSATVDALQVLGYGIAVNKPDKGLIITDKLLMASEAVVRGGPYSASARSLNSYRQYEIRIRKAGRGAVLTARPRAYANTEDVTEKKVWVTDGLRGEKENWSRLFGKISGLM
jgi:hypothetical protein